MEAGPKEEEKKKDTLERKSGGGGRNIHKRNCRDENGDNGDGDIRIGQGNGGRRRHWGPVAPVRRNVAGRRIKAHSFR